MPAVKTSKTSWAAVLKWLINQMKMPRLDTAWVKQPGLNMMVESCETWNRKRSRNRAPPHDGSVSECRQVFGAPRGPRCPTYAGFRQHPDGCSEGRPASADRPSGPTMLCIRAVGCYHTIWHLIPILQVPRWLKKQAQAWLRLLSISSRRQDRVLTSVRHRLFFGTTMHMAALIHPLG